MFAIPLTDIHQHLNSVTRLKAMYALNPRRSCSEIASQYQQLQNIPQSRWKNRILALFLKEKNLCC